MTLFSKFCTAQGAAKILSGNSIFITSPLDLNDPFEMRPAWRKEHEENQFKERLIRKELTSGVPLFACTENGLAPIGTMPALAVKPPIPPNDQIGLSDNYNLRVFEVLQRYFRVLSLVPLVVDISQNLTISEPDETLMWSHYGDQHQGICLILDADKFNNGLKAGGYAVNYKQKRESLPPSFYNTYQNLFSPRDAAIVQVREAELYQAYLGILTSKSPMWKYEREIRMIYDLAKLNPRGDFLEVSVACGDCPDTGIPKEKCTMPWFRDAVSLPPESVRGVIFGADCPINYVDELLPILSEERFRHVKLYSSSLHSDEYVIHYSEHDAETIRVYQQSYSEKIAHAKNHFFFRQGRETWSANAAQKGVNYHPPK
jgi:hypothetical protein